jgi:hypothetical protein
LIFYTEIKITPQPPLLSCHNQQRLQQLLASAATATAGAYKKSYSYFYVMYNKYVSENKKDTKKIKKYIKSRE